MSRSPLNRLLRPAPAGLLVIAAAILTGAGITVQHSPDGDPSSPGNVDPAASTSVPDAGLLTIQGRDALEIGAVRDDNLRPLHPALLPDGPWRWIMSQVYGPGPIDPQQNGVEGRGMLGTYPEEVAGGGIRFTLRRGVKFHNGDELTVHDIKASFEVFQRLVENEHPYVDYAFFFLESIEVDEEVNQVTIRMREGMTEQAYRLAAIPPLVREFYEDLPADSQNIIQALEEKMVETPIGLGGYTCPGGGVEGDGTSRPLVRLQSFDDYFQGEPQIREVVVHFYPNDREVIQAFITDEVQMVRLPTFRAVQALESQLPGSTHEGSAISIFYPWRNHHFFFLAFNNQIEPLNISALRRALPYAIKRKDSDFRDLPVGSPQLSDVPLHPKSRLAEYVSQAARGYLPRAGALKRIRESEMNTTRTGYPRDEQNERYELTLIYPNHVAHYETMARRIKIDLENLEFIVEPQALPPWELQRRLKEGDYELALFEMTMPPAPEMLRRLFHSYFSRSGINFTRHSSSAFDQNIYSATNSQLSSRVRESHLRDAIDNLYQEMPLLPLEFQAYEYYHFNSNILNGATLGRILSRMEPIARWRWAR